MFHHWLSTVVIGFLLPAAAGFSATPNEASYPCWRGASGSGVGTEAESPLVENLNQARRLWRSEARTPGAWTGDIKGGYNAPVIAAGRVYVSFYHPSGSIIDKDLFRVTRGDEQKRRHAALIEAQDVVLCLDLETGKTRWERRFDGGLNLYQARKNGPHTTCAVFDGRVFAQGSTGTIFCLDAATGECVWRHDDLPMAQAWRKTRDQCRAQEQAIAFVRKGVKRPGKLFCAAPVYGEGVVACGDARGGLVAFEASSGRKLWHLENVLSDYGSPVRWQHDGRTWFIGPLGHLVDPRTGEILWQAEGAYSGGTPVVNDRYMVACGGEGKADEPGPSGWRITPERATKLWQLEREYGTSHSTPVIYRGRLYLIPGTMLKSGGLHCIDLETGDITAVVNVRHGVESLLAGGGRILHLRESIGTWINADPADFRQLGGPWWLSAHAACTTPVLAGGLLVVRGKRHILCYDLRER